jgi:hypothetical protein
MQWRHAYRLIRIALLVRLLVLAQLVLLYSTVSLAILLASRTANLLESKLTADFDAK